MAYINVDVDVDDLYDSLRTSEKERIIELLRDDELLSDDDLLDEDDEKSESTSIMEQYFIDNLNSLKTKYFSLTREDIELIKMLNKKY
jgi:hypothetical protein